MPQIAQLAETFSSQIFWLLIIFGLVFVVVGRGMVPRVMDTVGMRDKQISDDLAAAQAARNQADEQEDAWRKRENANREAAHSLVADAKAKSAAASEKRLAEVQARLDGKIAGAEADIEKARTAAADELEAVAAEAVQDIVQRIAGIAIAQPAASDAVRKAMTHG